ncbi:hypothetical protein CCR75_005732 [Bremia lactucae]|uniref:Uncharacterized protein n=1 Tax=Bremia lactucae TaxID=4779 RepID=A0A976FRV3_BRELC|nr:hypothetical protein CCR75_005732 [Bremia lactucae]
MNHLSSHSKWFNAIRAAWGISAVKATECLDLCGVYLVRSRLTADILPLFRPRNYAKGRWFKHTLNTSNRVPNRRGAV